MCARALIRVPTLPREEAECLIACAEEPRYGSIDHLLSSLTAEYLLLVVKKEAGASLESAPAAG
jgi:hypothetical protein